MNSKKFKIELPKRSYPPSYYCKVWLELYDGGSDQWLYVCRYGMTYIFVEIIDMVAHCGRDASCQWCAEVSVVDLASASPDTIASAMRCCGCARDLDLRDEGDRLALAEMMFSYGAKSPMWSGDAGPLDGCFDSYGNATKTYSSEGNYFRQLRAEARREAEALFDEEARNRALDTRIVNKIGQTAREYAGGTDALWDALRRIKDDPNASAEQKLILRMYGTAGQTLGAGPVPEDLITRG